ncbi:MAG: type 4a pilus biogenesis protein PilO [Candidatus Omnitrophica bacterium]|nr:type 4a pilus biogenesis protein PilO [Candidatus Omnitrophota bacterium]
MKKINFDPLSFLKKAKKREIMAIALIICLLALAGYYLFFISPIVAKFLSAFREVSRTESRIAKAELSIDRMPVIKKEVGELKAKADFYLNKLPKEEEFPEVLERLSEMAMDTGVKITEIIPVKEELDEADMNSSDIYSQQRILIKALCGYHQLGTFIAALESGKRFMEVSDIEIAANPLNPKRHNVQLVVKTFILKGE